MLNLELMFDHSEDSGLHVALKLLLISVDRVFGMSNLGNFSVEVGCDSSNVPGRDVILAEHVDDVRFNVAGVSSLLHTGEVSVDVVEDANKFLTRVLLLKVVISMSDNVLSQDVSNGSVDSLVRPFVEEREGFAASSDHLVESELPSSVSGVEHTVFLDDVHFLVE